MKHITERRRCPKCKSGEMISTGQGLSNAAGTFWAHRCSQCKELTELKQCYPISYNEFEKQELEERWVD